jgi:hypothetical protein
MTSSRTNRARTVSVFVSKERRIYGYGYAYVPRIRIRGVSGVYPTGERYTSLAGIRVCSEQRETAPKTAADCEIHGRSARCLRYLGKALTTRSEAASDPLEHCTQAFDIAVELYAERALVPVAASTPARGFS